MHHPSQFTAFGSAAAGTLEVRSSERRVGSRLRTVYRVARVAANGDQGLARVLNVSDKGMMLSLCLESGVGDKIVVDLSETFSLHGTIMWREGRRCGVKLAGPIDSAGMLKRLFDERRFGQSRPLRLQFTKSVLASSEVGLQLVRLRDVSQSGMKVAHDGRLTAGLPVRVRLSAGVERRGVVRWSSDHIAGIMLTEMLTVEELGTLKTI